MADEKIAWEPHPVTPERKAELRVEGFTIVDARFKPAQAQDNESGVEQAQKPAAKPGRKPAQAQE